MYYMFNYCDKVYKEFIVSEHCRCSTIIFKQSVKSSDDATSLVSSTGCSAIVSVQGNQI